jgi:NAD(P)-dependent dehydrogenase (short-subunit alcohol dehydrogenase family)
MRLQNKVVIITGAGQGVGQAAALLFAREGAKVIVNDIDESRAGQTARLISQAGGECLVVTADISEEKQVQRLTSETLAKFGRIDILYNNAGIFINEDGSLPALDIWEQNIKVNLTGTYLTCKHIIPEFLKMGSGVILNTGSFVALRGVTFSQDAYAVSKGGVFTLTQAMAVKYGPRNIRVNCLAPGPIETPLMRQTDSLPGNIHLDRIPMRRFGQPEDVAKAALFLVSDEASWITGVIFSIDGGYSAITIHHLETSDVP